MKKNFVAIFKNYEVTIRFVSENNKKLSDAYGMTYFDECEIYIRNNLSEYLTFRTLIHELTHFALYAYDMSADDPTAEVGFKTEEQLCEFSELAIPEIYSQAWEILQIKK